MKNKKENKKKIDKIPKLDPLTLFSDSEHMKRKSNS